LAEKERNQGASHAEIDADVAGQRLDNYLMTRLKGVPRSHVYQLIRSGQVRVNSGRVRPKYRLKTGDSVRLPPVRRRAAPTIADPGTGLAVHGGSGLDFGLIEGLRSLRPAVKTLELVHRLDRGTSGCVMVAKKRSVLRALHGLLREEGAVRKRYLALVRGRWEHGEIEIDMPLAASRDGSAARVRPAADGKAALSRFRLVNQYRDFASLVEVEIETGRTHQIRVHAAEAGHPIAGDDRYGDRKFNLECEARGLKRMFLHAVLIEFTWPGTDEEFVVSTPLPDELRAFLDALGTKRDAAHALTRSILHKT